MTKADIVNEIAKNTGIDKATVLATVEAFMETVKDSLAKNENVYLRQSLSSVLQGVRFYLHKAVQKRMMTERPIGCLLSGGLDSTLGFSATTSFTTGLPVSAANSVSYLALISGSESLL